MIYPSKLCEILICCIKIHLEQVIPADQVQKFSKTSSLSHAKVPSCVELHDEHNGIFRS